MFGDGYTPLWDILYPGLRYLTRRLIRWSRRSTTAFTHAQYRSVLIEPLEVVSKRSNTQPHVEELSLNCCLEPLMEVSPPSHLFIFTTTPTTFNQASLPSKAVSTASASSPRVSKVAAKLTSSFKSSIVPPIAGFPLRIHTLGLNPTFLAGT